MIVILGVYSDRVQADGRRRSYPLGDIIHADGCRYSRTRALQTTPSRAVGLYP